MLGRQKERTYLGHIDDGMVLSLRVKLFTSAVINVHHVASKLNNSKLHTKADTQEGALLGTSPCNCLDHTGRVTGTESTGHQQTVSSANSVPSLVELGRVGLQGLIFQMAGINPDQLELLMTVHGGVFQGLGHTDVCILEGSVFSNQGDGDCVVGVVLATGEVNPVLPHEFALFNDQGIPRDGGEIQQLSQCANKLLFLKKQRHVVGGRDVVHGNNLLGVHGAHVGNLLNGAVFQRQLAATGDQVRIQTRATNIANSPLSGLGLLLVVDDGHVRHVNLSKVALASPTLELADGVNERRTLNISNSTTQLDDADIRLAAGLVDGDLGNALDPVLDGVGDVGDDLNGLAKIAADTLALDHLLVDLASLEL